MTNKDSFYLQDIELLKQLAPIMAKKGIDGDAYLTDYGGVLTHEAFVAAYRNDREGAHERLKTLQNTYRKDSLEAALPEWCFGSRTMDGMLDALADYDSPFHAFIVDNYMQILDAILMRGQESLKALAQLIILLDKEGVE